MNRHLERAREEASGAKIYVLAAYYLAASNVTLLLATIGLVTILLGALVVPSWNEVLAGMFGVWGASLLLLGLGGYVALWFNEGIQQAAV